VARQAVQSYASTTTATHRGSLYRRLDGPQRAIAQAYGPLEEEQVLASYAEQARALVEAGVDLLVIETQFDLNEATLALKAARTIPWRW